MGSEAMESEPYLVAHYARRFELLARRPELLNKNREDRVAHSFGDSAGPGPLHLLDIANVVGAGELDFLCAYAVTILRKPGGASAALLDVLGILDPVRVAAIAFALPEERRRRLRRDPYWNRAISEVECAMPEAIAALDELIDETPTSEVGYALARIDVELGEIARSPDPG
jgi:hypothetical protein